MTAGNSLRSARSALLPLLGAGALLLSASCAAEPGPERTLESRRGPFADLETLGRVTIHDPARSVDGVHLTFFRQRTPVLLDTNGRIVHAWPDVRARSRMRLLPDGGLLVFGVGRSVMELDWEGHLRWQRRFRDALPHHDLIRLTNGNTLLLTRAPGAATDDLVELDRTGRTVSVWRSAEHLASELPRRSGGPGDITHLNSVQELPDNPWFEAGDERFRPGNLLVSARNLNALYILDRRTGEPVWRYDHELDLQHEASMIGPGLPNHGKILLFDNAYRGRYRYRRTEIREIDPRDGRTTWSWTDQGFWSPTSGVQQPVGRGNVLVTSTRGGRVFEVDRDGEIVWQWIPPFDPVRTARYPWDHCPQLAHLARGERRRVVPAPGYRHVDPPIYRFARRRDLRRAHVAGETRRILVTNDRCADLVLPAEPTLETAFGLHPRRPGTGTRNAAAFAAWIETEGSRPIDLLRETLGPAGPREASRTLSLGPWAARSVRLCLDADVLGAAAGEPSEQVAWWQAPVIRDAAGPESVAAELDPDDDPEALSDEEREAQVEHLRALGYVD